MTFATTTTQIGQDNPHLFWDDVNNRLGVGTATPGTALHVDGTISAVNQLTGNGLQSMRWAEPAASGYIAIAPSVPAIMFDLSTSTNIVKSGIQAIVQVRHPGGGALPPTPTMNVQGMAVQIFTPPDNGGDCSGFFCQQTGGGNAASFFNFYNERPSGFEAYPANGNAVEAQSDGTKTTIFVGLRGTGTGIMAVQQAGGANASFQSFTGDTGRAFVAQSLASKSPNNDGVLTVVNYAGTQQTVSLDYDGNFNTLGNASFAGGLYVSGVAAFGSGAASRSPPKMLITGISGGFNGAGTSGILQLTTGNGAVTSNMLELGYVDGLYGYIQSSKPGTAVQALSLNPSGGNVGIGTVAPNTRLTVDGPPGAYGFVSDFGNNLGTAGGAGIAVKVGPNGADSASNMIGFYDYGITANIGNIYRTGTNQVGYGTSSDQRLKENIVESEMGLEDLLKLKVRDFNFEDGERQQGFVAQELYEVYPEAVRVGGDNPGLQPWMIDYGRLTPLLVRAIQQLAAKIEGN